MTALISTRDATLKTVSLPTISIVVPNFNGADCLERCLTSLAKQEYAGLQVIVIDGGSTDGSMGVVGKFPDLVSYAVSERDRGQAHALNKGFAVAAGEIVNWLCSDDYLLPGALSAVGRRFQSDSDVDVLVGAAELQFLQTESHSVMRPGVADILRMPCGNPIAQVACFFRRSLLGRIPPIDESYNYAMDFELWNYFLYEKKARFAVLDTVLAVFPLDGTNKTSVGGEKIIVELERIYKCYCDERIPLTFWHRKLRLPMERARKVGQGWYPLIRFGQICVVLALAPFYGLARVRAMNWTAFL